MALIRALSLLAFALSQLHAAPVVMLKLDDVTRNGAHGTQAISARWQRCVDFLEKEGLHGNLGIIGNSLEADTPVYFEWIKKLQRSGAFEFWNHGYADKADQFKGPAAEEQRTALENTQRLAREKLGFSLTAFGVHWSQTDAGTVQALAAIPELKVWLFGTDAASGKILLERTVNLEQPTFVPNLERVRADYERYGSKRPFLLLQGHPNGWDDARFDAFVKVVQYLKEQGCRFLTVSEYLKTR